MEWILFLFGNYVGTRQVTAGILSIFPLPVHVSLLFAYADSEICWLFSSLAIYINE